MTTSIREELTRRSPLRLLDRSLSGGPGPGSISVLASPKGVGKTACLVHIAADRLIQGKPVIHVSYADRVDYIITWYEDIFKELAGLPGMKAASEIYEDIIRNRVIMNFKQDGARTEQVLRSVEAMIVHGRIAADTVIIDGFDFSRATPAELVLFKEFAGRVGARTWFSASLRGEGPLCDERGVPRLLLGFMDVIDVLLTLQHHGDHVHLTLVKDREKLAARDLRLRLDPRSLLIVKETGLPA